MSEIRAAAVAGLFYPDEPGELRSALRAYLAEATPVAGQSAPKALIVPHAGYVYSGPVAASAYACLTPVADRIRRVVLLGPAHRVAVRGLALPSATHFQTPLGRVPLDTTVCAALQALPQVSINDATHASEHSLEVHLPFLQELLGEFSLVPMVVGDSSAEEVADVLDAVWGDEETLIVISSDLSHYLDYDSARELDAQTSRAIEEMRYEDISYEQACGRIPVSGLLLAARRRGLHVRQMDLRNSGDTAGDRQRVVGYGAYVIN